VSAASIESGTGDEEPDDDRDWVVLDDDRDDDDGLPDDVGADGVAGDER
jgi:hypothetical protein